MIRTQLSFDNYCPTTTEFSFWFSSESNTVIDANHVSEALSQW